MYIIYVYVCVYCLCMQSMSNKCIVRAYRMNSICAVYVQHESCHAHVHKEIAHTAGHIETRRICFQLFFSHCLFQSEKKCWETSPVARVVGLVQKACIEWVLGNPSACRIDPQLAESPKGSTEPP